MKIDILTLFPEMIEGVLGQSIIGRAREFGLIQIQAHNIRDYSPDKRRRTDDYPYGGGMGMVMQCEPLYQAWLAARQDQPIHTILMSPQGAPFCQQKAKELLERDRFILVCGHYEGVDQRFIDECVDEEISLGDFVLTGGEIAAAAIADAVCRMVPGVLAEDASFTEESHFAGLLEYPQYTRPEQWRGRQVPEILLSGHHKNIQNWRRLQSLLRTRQRRPDLFAQLELTPEDQKLLSSRDAPAGSREAPTGK